MKKLLSFFLFGICTLSVYASNAPCMPASGCTGISNSNTSTITLGGAFSTEGIFSMLGAYSFSGALTGNTSLTFPTSGTLISSAGSYSNPSWITSLDGAKLTGTVTPSSAAGGDLTGTYPSPTIASLAVTNAKIANGTIDLTSKVTGVLPAANGGTAQSSYVLGDILYSSATNTLSKLSGNVSSSKQYLSQTGTGTISAAPAWASIAGSDITGAALTKIDDTNVTLALGGTPSTALLRSVSLTLGWSGTLSSARGGIGLDSSAWAQGDVPYISATGVWNHLAKDTNATRYLSNTGTTNNPAWAQINLTNGVTGTLPNSNTTATDGVTSSSIVARDASGSFSANAIDINSFTSNGKSFGTTFNLSSLTASKLVGTDVSKDLSSVDLTGDVTTSGGFATTIATNSVSNAKFRQSSALSVVGNSANATGDVADISAASDNQVLRRSGTAIAFGAINLASSSAVTGTVPVANGGTGQTTYTNGQILIGNTTGNTLSKATLTGTTNQINITNGGGSITLSTPQSINTSSSPQFAGLTLPGASSLIFTPTPSNVLNISSSSGGSNRADFELNRFDLANGNNRLIYLTGGSNKWSTGARSGSENYIIWDESNSVAQLTMAQGSGTSGTSTFAGDLTANGNLSVATAGKVVKIKSGSNASVGTSATLVAGTVTVNTTAVATGDIILLSCTAAGGTQGVVRTSAISNGTSFTLTSSSGSDTSTYSWVIIRPT